MARTTPAQNPRGWAKITFIVSLSSAALVGLLLALSASASSDIGSSVSRRPREPAALVIA
jgi:hypothetical protein